MLHLKRIYLLVFITQIQHQLQILTQNINKQPHKRFHKQLQLCRKYARKIFQTVQKHTLFLKTEKKFNYQEKMNHNTQFNYKKPKKFRTTFKNFVIYKFIHFMRSRLSGDVLSTN